MSFPNPPNFDTTTTTAPADLSLTDLSNVDGHATTTAPQGPGTANIHGTVVGPDGPVPAASVGIDLEVGDATSTQTVLTNPDGTWTLPAVPGGRYRIRSWRAPDLALPNPTTFFLMAGQSQMVPLTLSRFTNSDVVPAVAPNPPIIHQLTTLGVKVTNETVSASGQIIGTPVPNTEVQLVPSGAGLVVYGTNPTVTDGSGQAVWQVTCEQLSGQQFTIVVNGLNSYPFTLSGCGTPPTTTTTTTGSPGSSTTSTAPSAVGTSTTFRTRRTTTTSTTKPFVL
jgi:hypothetical protein